MGHKLTHLNFFKQSDQISDSDSMVLKFKSVAVFSKTVKDVENPIFIIWYNEFYKWINFGKMSLFRR